MRVAEVMRSAPTTAPSTLSLAAARRQLSACPAEALVVVDDDQRLLGILSEWDLAGTWPSGATSLTRGEVQAATAELTLQAIMTRDVLWVSPATSVVDAARLLRDYRIAALPVLADGRVVGVLTEFDLARVLAGSA